MYRRFNSHTTVEHLVIVYMNPTFAPEKQELVKYSKNIMLNLGVLPFPYVYKSVYAKKEDDTYAKIEGKGVSDSLSQ